MEPGGRNYDEETKSHEDTCDMKEGSIKGAMSF